MKCENIILLAGRPASGKTEMMIAYANQFPKTTLVLSEGHSKARLHDRGLNKSITIVSQNEFNDISLDNYETLCVTYIELFEEKDILKIISIAQEKSLRLVLLSYINRHCKINNILNKIDRSKST